ncbi:ubiquinone/menaquinone biosynthesis C-methylase UbiE [Actinoplanes octamycinicus]|uniref:Ubiquinone/menaquinone biosynthesis C-methylase UbiE n=1 Tax=Actinoplanes octamycinicus TaxID=135948 RepID=A0A7W7H4I1_9ACTN|nr:methyltransferase domain-containing protein [Actinoplanes octamycinicus]MBB4743860.1 ubiquinone/menaquinone biosynthesis C-methylase UbiE [Actinoplanes octamycinicus]GIE58489.1 methyltransferase [Actinoplanes octamycinicus]
MTFDQRAAGYARHTWHVRYAERLVELAAPVPGSRVLDAATGTGLAAIAAARAVGPQGRVTGVDISAAMLDQARQAVSAPNVELVKADASRLRQFPDGSFDLVLCSAGLLYLPVHTALREWRRLLVPGGRVGFSTMHDGFPVAARVFRKLAAGFGLDLADPAAPLGTPDRCEQALRNAGLEPAEQVVETVEFSAADLEHAWEAHAHGPHQAALALLTPAQLAEFQQSYTGALTDLRATDPDTLRTARVIYAFGRKPAA